MYKKHWRVITTQIMNYFAIQLSDYQLKTKLHNQNFKILP